MSLAATSGSSSADESGRLFFDTALQQSSPLHRPPLMVQQTREEVKHKIVRRAGVARFLSPRPHARSVVVLDPRSVAGRLEEG